jgi:hypothetical protein
MHLLYLPWPCCNAPFCALNQKAQETFAQTSSLQIDVSKWLCRRIGALKGLLFLAYPRLWLISSSFPGHPHSSKQTSQCQQTRNLCTYSPMLRCRGGCSTSHTARAHGRWHSVLCMLCRYAGAPLDGLSVASKHSCMMLTSLGAQISTTSFCRPESLCEPLIGSQQESLGHHSYMQQYA